MHKYVIASVFLALSVTQGPVAAQGGGVSSGNASNSPHKCEFYDDFEQAVCSGQCGAAGKSWIADKLPSVDNEGNEVAGEGHCED